MSSSSSRISVQRAFQPVPFAVWFAVLVVGGFPDVILGTGSFVLRDFNGFGYPLAAWHKASFWRGELPLWNPLSLGGVPFLAQWNTMTLYPGTLIYLLLPLPVSLGWFCLAHLYLGGLGMYALARRLTGDDFAAAVGATGFAWCGLMQNSLMWPNNVAALGWLPWVVLLVLHACRSGRGSLLMAIGAGSMQMLTGAPEVILFTWIVSGVAVIAMSGTWLVDRTSRLAGIVVGVGGVGAVQLLPFFDLLKHSQRLSHGQAVEWAADPLFWTRLAIPIAGIRRFENDVYFQPGQQWLHSYYAGLIVIFLALGAVLLRRDLRLRLLVLGTVVAAWLAVGEGGGLYTWVNHVVPLGVMRFPVKFYILTAVALPLLAAWGMATAGGGERGRKFRPWFYAGGVVVVWFAIATTQIGRGVGEGEVVNLSIINGVERAIWFVGGAGLFLALLRGGAEPRRGWLKLAFILVLWVDLKTHQPNLAPRVAPRLFTMENPVMATLEPFPTAGAGRIYRWPDTRWRTEEFDEDSLDRRLMRGRLELSPNLNLPERVAMFDGFFSLWFPMFDGIGAMLLRQDGGLNEELADFLAITHTTSTNAFGEWPRRESAHPWITVGQRPRFTSTAEALQQVANGWWDAGREVFLGTEWRGKITADEDRAARVEDVEFGTQRVRFDVIAERDTMAVIAQFHHRWWEATVDGQTVEVLPANLGFQAVAVPAGRHRVELRYVDRWIRYGAAMTSLTLLLLAGLAWHWRKAMKGPVPPR